MTSYAKSKDEQLQDTKEKYKGKTDTKTLESTVLVKDSNIEVL